jgi:hypothetical protein
MTTRNPVFEWEDFRSPEYKPYERRSFNLHVGRVTETAPYWEGLWDFYLGSPNETQVVVGKDSRAKELKLEDGEYWVTFQYVEARAFGPLKIRRASRTTRQMLVKGA